MQAGDEVTHPQWGKGTVLFDKAHCIGVRFIEHGQVNFSQEEWKSQKSPPSRFRSLSDLEFRLQQAVDNMELTEEQAVRLLQQGAHPLEVQKQKRPSLVQAHQRFMDEPSNKAIEDDFYTSLLGFITAQVKRSCHDGHTFNSIEDAIQESAVEVWQRLKEFDPSRSSFPGWVGLITTHNIRDVLRSQRTSRGQRQRQPDSEAGTVQLSEEDMPSAALPVDVQFELKERLSQLSRLDRSIVLMTADGLTLREIGAALNLSHVTIQKRLKKLKLQVNI